MLVGFYSSASGKVVKSKSMEIISRNLANVNTTGFKRNMASFKVPEDHNIENGPPMPTLVINHGQGSLKRTGNKLDVAIHGDGYFAMESDQGLRFTRNGRFLLNSEKEIVNGMGWKLMGSGGAIKLPGNARDVLINSDGSVVVNGTSRDSIRVVDFANKADLVEVGSSSFRSKIGDVGEETSGFTIQQGFLENSNVSVVDEMVTMMANMRSFQGNNTVNKTTDRTLEKLIRTAYTVI